MFIVVFPFGCLMWEVLTIFLNLRYKFIQAQIKQNKFNNWIINEQTKKKTGEN